MTKNQQPAMERADLAAWRRRDQLRRGNAARPVPSLRVYRRSVKNVRARDLRDA
ncbi:hypothetical protein [Nocardia sp. IFM 10818]